MTKKIFILPLLASYLFATPSYEVALTIGKQEFHNPAIVAYERIYGVRASIMENRLYKHGYGVELGYEWSNKINCKDLSLGRAYANFLVQTKEFYNIKPYFVAGFGHESLDPTIEEEPSQNIFQYGIGAKYFLSQNINIFLETKAIKKFKTNNSDHITNIGIGYLFNKKAQRQNYTNKKISYYQPPSSIVVEKEISEIPIIDLTHTVSSDIAQQKSFIQRPQQIVATPPTNRYNKPISIDKSYYIQMAAYESTNPNKLKREIRDRGYSNIKLHTIMREGKALTLILVGPYKSRRSATNQLKNLKKIESGAFIYKI